jgi:hypothetical protein
MGRLLMDIAYAISIAGILVGIALLIDGLRRLKNETTSTSRSSRPHVTWIYR